MKRLTIVVFCLLYALSYHKSSGSELLNKEEAPSNYTFISFLDIVIALNYPVETHKITTEDGYILTYFRIQAKNQPSMKSGLPVVYLQHGLIDSADTWVVNSEENALGFLLANEGYDVWCGNSRGNKYSMEHVTLNSSDPAFWQFSWQNMSVYDLPAAFEYINNVTDQNIIYISHSQGSPIMLGALADGNVTVMKYLTTFVALAPITWVQNVGSGPFELFAHSDLIFLLQALGIYDFMPPNFFESLAGHTLCTLAPEACGDALAYFFGYDPTYDDYSRYNIFLEHFPSGTSLMDIMHWRQLVLSGRFCKYDFGPEENMIKYGQATPPDWNLTNIVQKVHLFLGDNDTVGDLEDQQTLLAHMMNSNTTHKVYPAEHMTWIWSKNISFYYSDLLQAIQEDSS